MKIVKWKRPIIWLLHEEQYFLHQVHQTEEGPPLGKVTLSLKYKKTRVLVKVVISCEPVSMRESGLFYDYFCKPTSEKQAEKLRKACNLPDTHKSVRGNKQ